VAGRVGLVSQELKDYENHVMKKPSKTLFVFFAIYFLLAMVGICFYLYGQGISATYGAILAFILIPIYFSVIYFIDRYEKEPTSLLVISFLWGATFTFAISLLLNTILGRWFSDMFGVFPMQIVPQYIAPVVEECAKAIILFGLFIFVRKEFNGLVDGIVYASMVAIGFAMSENIVYYSMNMHDIGRVFYERGVLSPFAHPLFTSMTGLGLVFSLKLKSKIGKTIVIISGLFMAILLHSLWNYSLLLGLKYFHWNYFAIVIPCLIGIGIIIRNEWKTETGIILTYLERDGLNDISREEYDSWKYRTRTILKDIFTLHFKLAYFRSKYYNAITELAYAGCHGEPTEHLVSRMNYYRSMTNENLKISN
jgi:protease PrsW